MSAQPWTPPISVNGGTSFFTSQGQIASQDVIFEVDFGATAFARTLEFTITCNTNAGIEISLCDTDRSAAATSIAEWVAANPILRLQGSTLPAGGGSIAINYVTPAYSGRHRFCYTIQPDQSLAGGTWTPTFPCGFTISVNDISAGAPGPSVPYQLVGDWDQALPAATIGSTTNVFSEVWSGGVAVGNGNLNAAADQLQFDYEVNFGAASNTCTLGMIAYVATTSTGAGSTTFEFYDLQNDGGQTPTFTLSTTVGAAAFQTRTTASLTGLQRFRVIVKLGTGSTPSSNMFFQVTFGTVNPGTTAANRALTVIAPPVTPPIIYTPTAPTTKVTVTPAGTTGAPVAGAPAPASGASWTSTNNFSATGGKEAGNYAWTIQSVTPITGGAPAWTGLAMTASPTASGIATNITGTAPTVTGPSTYRIVLRATRGFEWGETVIDVTVGGAAGTPTLTVNPTGTITVPTTTAGTAGTAASFTVSGSNLTPASGNVTLALTST
ncbi:MAG: hypothetical protein DPW14_06965, partial [Planctomycetes bacterium]|nr:hypothetical protein [Planctomycetota bacterium]